MGLIAKLVANPIQLTDTITMWAVECLGCLSGACSTHRVTVSRGQPAAAAEEHAARLALGQTPRVGVAQGWRHGAARALLAGVPGRATRTSGAPRRDLTAAGLGQGAA